MKTLKYLFVGVMMLSVSTPSLAQDAKTAAQQAENIAKNKPANAKDLLKDLYKNNKKNAEALVAAGNAFLANKDTTNASAFAGYARKVDGKYAPVYMLLGDIAAFANDGGGAVTWYDQAIYFDPKNPEPYYKYASVYRTINPTQAISKLEDLRTQRPDLAVDAYIGRIYYNANEFEKAANSYSKAELGKMEEKDITNFAMSYYFNGIYAKSLDICKKALEKNPHKAAYNRLAFFNSTDLGDFENALVYADALFNKSDSAEFSYFDYTYYGKALTGAKQYEKAVEMLNKALSFEFDNQDKKAGVVKELSEAYRKKGDFANAITSYKKYLDMLSKTSANDMAALGQLHVQYANELKDAERTAEFDKAEKVYADLEAKFENAKLYATFMRARVNAFKDPESKQGLAKPFYEKLIELISSVEKKDATDKARLVESFRYMISYYLICKDDKATAKSYAAKLMEVDPENETAKQVMSLK